MRDCETTVIQRETHKEERESEGHRERETVKDGKPPTVKEKNPSNYTSDVIQTYIRKRTGNDALGWRHREQQKRVNIVRQP